MRRRRDAAGGPCHVSTRSRFPRGNLPTLNRPRASGLPRSRWSMKSPATSAAPLPRMSGWYSTTRARPTGEPSLSTHSHRIGHRRVRRRPTARADALSRVPIRRISPNSVRRASISRAARAHAFHDLTAPPAKALPKTPEFAAALDLYQGRRYREAKAAFLILKTATPPDGGTAVPAAFYEMECLRKLGDLDGLAEAGRGFVKDPALGTRRLRQLEIDQFGTPSAPGLEAARSSRRNFTRPAPAR